MNPEKRTGWLNGKKVLVLVLVVAAVYFLVTTLVDQRFQKLESETRLKVSDQGTLLLAIAETTARNGADEVTESIVRDCSVNERSQFDSLLGRLDSGLSRSELTELERLFGRCGSFYSERKSMMASRLSREMEIYKDYVELLSVITETDQSSQFKVVSWQELADEELKQSKMFFELVQLQDEIIKNLLLGKTVDSEEISSILHRVNETQETLQVANKQAANLRKSLVSL